MRISLAQLNYKIGDFSGNYAKIENVITQHAKNTDLIVFTELCLSGYYPMDLIESAPFISAQNACLAQLEQLTQKHQISIIIGFIDINQGKGKPFHNSLCLISKGKRTYTYHKRLLPVYDIFDEARHFTPGKEAGIFQFEGLQFGFLICEDGWVGDNKYLYDCDPVSELSKHNLDIIICINGSPSNIGKQALRCQHFTPIAQTCHAPLIFTNQVGGNDDILYDGASFVLDADGKPLGSLAQFKEDFATLTLNQKTLELSSEFSPYQALSDSALFYQQTILGLKDYALKSGFQKVVIGVSGGIDSAITLALAVKALGSENVTALAMPSRYSSKGSLEDAALLCDVFKVKMFTVSIEDEFALSLARFEKVFSEKPHSLTEQNMQARLRGRILMEYSNQTGALVLSTGNKSELSVGYTTIYGDMTGGFNLIGDLYKTQVYELAHYFNQINPTLAIPATIISKIPSAELAPNQKDSDALPPYEELDPILKLYIEGNLLPKAEYDLYQNQVSKMPGPMIKKVHQMVDNAEFKRRQSAPIIRVQRKAFGIGRRLPIAANYPK